MGQKTITVFGIGRVGLPLALSFAEAGCKVIGHDIDNAKLACVSSGGMPFLEDGAEPLLKKHIDNNFTVTNNIRKAMSSDNLIYTIGTPVDENFNPVVSWLEGMILESTPYMKKNQLIVLRSTVSPQTTEYLKRQIEKKTQFKVGTDIFLAFCPERIAEGKAIEEIKEIPQIIGGVEPNSSKKAKSLFDIITSETIVTDSRSAELSKLFCNMYRYVNFGIANEFMILSESFGRNYQEINHLINHNYKRGGLPKAGFSAGACLYKDGFYLINKVPFQDLISTAWKINESIPAYLIENLNKVKPLEGANVALLGIAFKKNVDDDRYSLAHKTRKILTLYGANVTIHDPHMRPADLTKMLKNSDVVFIGTNHDYYRDLGLQYFRKHSKKDAVICDVWNLFSRDTTYPLHPATKHRS